MKPLKLGDWDLQYSMPRGWAMTYCMQVRSGLSLQVPDHPTFQGGVYTGTNKGFRTHGKTITWDELDKMVKDYIVG